VSSRTKCKSRLDVFPAPLNLEERRPGQRFSPARCFLDSVLAWAEGVSQLSCGTRDGWAYPMCVCVCAQRILFLRTRELSQAHETQERDALPALGGPVMSECDYEIGR
jgi:hypothetical protein